MKKVFIIMTALALLGMSVYLHAAGQKTSGDILKEGLLGAGAGAIGGAASGAETKDLWKGALAGAGVNIVGGALLDSISGEKVGNVSDVQSLPPESAYSKGYGDGYNNGFKQGYTEGYKEGIKEGMKPSN